MSVGPAPTLVWRRFFDTTKVKIRLVLALAAKSIYLHMGYRVEQCETTILGLEDAS